MPAALNGKTAMTKSEYRKRRTKLQRDYRHGKPHRHNERLTYSILGVRIGEEHRRVAEKVLR